MNALRLIAADLRGRWRANLALAIAVAITCATIVGSLMVGDSIRGSLRRLALERLGEIGVAIHSRGYFGDELAGRLAKAWRADRRSGTGDEDVRFIPALLTDGTAVNTDASARCNDAAIYAADSVAVEPGGCVINRVMALRLGVAPGDEIVLRVPRRRGVAETSPLTGLTKSEQLGGLRVAVTAVEDGRAFRGRFELYPTQQARPIAWLNLDELQRAADCTGLVNTVLVTGTPPREPLAALVKGCLSPADAGVALQRRGDALMLTSPAIHLPAAVESAFAGDPSASRVLTGLLEEASHGERRDHYGLAVGMDDPPGGALDAGRAAVNRWLADRLGLSAGDALAISYYTRADDGAIATEEATLTIARIIPMTGDGANEALAPDYPGITDAESPADWSAPGGLEIDMALVGDAEERYWHEYRAAPRVFVGYAQARELWGRDQTATALRITGPQAEARARRVLAGIDPAALGIELVPVREMQLAAASGSTDFAELLLSLSGLIWLAAGLLAGLILSLTIVAYRRQATIMLNCGHDLGRLIRIFTAEPAAACLLGLALGAVGGIGFCRAIILGLATLWIGATGTSELWVFVEPATILQACAAMAAAMLFAIAMTVYFSVRKLAGLGYAAGTTRRTAKSKRMGLTRVALLAGLPTAALAVAVFGDGQAAGRPVTLGALLGIWIIALAATSLRSRPATAASKAGGLRLARLAGAARPVRLTLVAAMTALSIYGLALTAIFSGVPADDGRDSRLLIVDLASPVPVLPETPEQRRLLGFTGRSQPLWTGAEIAGVRIHRAEDISCHNMTRPTRASVASVDLDAPTSVATLKRFGLFDKLDGILGAAGVHGENRIAAASDAAAAQYILQIKPGDSVPARDARGRTVILRLAGVLTTDSFAGELIVSQADFRRLYPDRAGFDRLLIAPGEGVEATRLAETISKTLADYGAEVSTLRALRLRRSELRDAYLAAFRLLGVIAALLGVCGLGTALYRSLLDKRRELAMLWALGFSARPLTLWACGESALAVATGLLAALAALAPAMLSRYVNPARLTPVTTVMTALALTALVIQLLVTYRFVAKLDVRDLASE